MRGYDEWYLNDKFHRTNANASANADYRRFQLFHGRLLIYTNPYKCSCSEVMISVLGTF